MAHTKLKTFHLFAGAGGGELADILLGHIPVGACEIEEYPRNVLLQRMQDGILPFHPVWDDICTLDGKPWRGKVDMVCGGFPCQDISAAGKGAGIDGERSGLWGEMARFICEVSPRFVFVENSPMLTSRGLGTVLGDLAAMGYDAKWCVLGACDAGAPHKRDRIWILAESRFAGTRREHRAVGDDEASASSDSQGRSDAMGDERRVLGATTPSAGEQCDLANSAVHGHSATEKREGTIERSDNGEAGAQPSGEPARLCASAAVGKVGGHVSADVADSNGSGGHEDSSNGELRANRAEQSSEDSRPTYQTEGREVASWWHTDPAELPDADDKGLQGSARESGAGAQGQPLGHSAKSNEGEGADRPAKPFVGRVAHGVANRVDRLKAIGNGQVPQCAALAWRILSEGLDV